MSSPEGTPVAPKISVENAEISEKVCTPKPDDILEENDNDEEKSNSELSKTKDKSESKCSQGFDLKQSKELDDSENIEANETVVYILHMKQKLLTKKCDLKSSSSDGSDTTDNNKEGDASKCQSDSRSLTNSDIEPNILEGKTKVLHKVKIKQEPMDSSSYC